MHHLCVIWALLWNSLIICIQNSLKQKTSVFAKVLRWFVFLFGCAWMLYNLIIRSFQSTSLRKITCKSSQVKIQQVKLWSIWIGGECHAFVNKLILMMYQNRRKISFWLKWEHSWRCWPFVCRIWDKLFVGQKHGRKIITRIL